jgi:agmatine deiminase
MKRISPKLQRFAARLRGKQTDAEQRLWERIRGGQIKEWKFRRQHPIGGYVVDFCCLEGMLIIEVGGGQHLEQEKADEERTKYLRSVGFRVLRFWNDDVLMKTDDVLEEILKALESSDDPYYHPNSLPSREREKRNTSFLVEGESSGKDFHPSLVLSSRPSPGRERENDRQGENVIDTSRHASAELGLRMPAEWERHEATWIGWPHNTTDWPGKMSAIQWVYGEIVRHLSVGELVRILVNNKAHELKARRVLDRVGALADRVEFVRIPTNRGWTRDFGPIFLKHGDPQAQMCIARFQFNAWAHYPDWQKDNRIPQRVAAKLHIPLVQVTQQNRGVVLEGGSIDVNGQGTLLTTEECLMDDSIQVRNPGFSRQDYEEVFRRYLGVTQVLWLGKGIAGDDTHGHVDDLCRFVDPYTVVLCQESNPSDANYRALAENQERIESMRCEDGRKVGMVPLPMPAPLYFDEQRLPASYANFYIGNSVVLVPTFNDPNDRMALGILSELFPDRTVVGIHAVDLVWGFGTIHCLTQQQAAL